MADKVAEKGAAEPVAQTSVDQQDEAFSKVADEKPVDLSNHPQFRKMQSEYQSRIARMENQNRQLTEQMEQLATRGLDEGELSEYQKSRLEQALQERDEELNALRGQFARQEALQAIAIEAEVPLDAIVDARTPDEAWRMALQYTKKNGVATAKKKAAAEQKKADDNDVVLGGGASSSLTEWEKKVRDAYENGRTTEYVRLIRNQPEE